MLECLAADGSVETQAYQSLARRGQGLGAQLGLEVTFLREGCAVDAGQKACEVASDFDCEFRVNLTETFQGRIENGLASYGCLPIDQIVGVETQHQQQGAQSEALNHKGSQNYRKCRQNDQIAIWKRVRALGRKGQGSGQSYDAAHPAPSDHQRAFESWRRYEPRR